MMTRAEAAPALESREVSRWGGSLALVLALHGAVLAGLAAHRDLALSPGEPLPAVMLDLAPAAASATAAPSPTPPGEAVQPDPVLEQPPDPFEPEVAPPEPAKADASRAEPPPMSVADLPPPSRVVEQAAVALPQPPPNTVLPAKAAPIRPTKLAELPKTAKRVAEATKQVKPAQEATAQRAERRVLAQRPAIAASGQSTGAASGRQTTASLPAAGSGDSAASRAGWQGALVAHLRRHLLPQGGQTGSASVRFSVDRSGRVTGASLVASAGAPSLDSEALAVFRRAQPMPPPPADVPGASFSFTVPIRFTTR